jgi:hypothetical protein
MAENDERLNDIEETSKRLAVSTFTTRRLIKLGQLRACADRAACSHPREGNSPRGARGIHEIA